MPRYTDDYLGISGRPEPPRGMDPNHRDGYQGQRMRAGPGQAAYGWHRWSHPDDFDGSGGFHGHHAGESRDGRTLSRARPPYDREMRGGGGVHDWRYDTEYLRDFNATSTRFRDDGGWGGNRQRGGGDGRLPSGRSAYDTGFRWRYGNRGMSRGGYSDSWSWGPMRGSR